MNTANEGSEKASNSSNNTLNGISSPANASLQQSLYIAALDRYLGIRGLVSPVTDTNSGLSYDFYHPASGRLIKVFKALSSKHLAEYEQSRPTADPLYIVDGIALEDSECPGCGEMHANFASEDLADALLVFDVLVYADDLLWQFDDEEEEWEPMIPVERSRCMGALLDLADE